MTLELTTPYGKRALRLFTFGAIAIGSALCWFLSVRSTTVTVLSVALAIFGAILGIIALFIWRRHEIEVRRHIDRASAHSKSLKA